MRPHDPRTPLAPALLVVGTTSGAGKSTVVTALCRSLARRGHRVAPFKAQNMANHASVTVDGGEIGRAQAAQAEAAGVDPEISMNPILLKPIGDRTSRLVVRGREVGGLDASQFGETLAGLRPVVGEALDDLRRRFDLVVAEGAGGAAEINLLDHDVVNLPLALEHGLAAVLVVDIERGGAFASAHGTLDLLPDELRRTVRGIVVNRFRGDPTLLSSGLRELERRHGVPVLGVLPWLDGPLLDQEDSADLHLHLRSDPVVAHPLRAAVVALPHLANPADLDPLLVEPGVEMVMARRAGDLAGADLVILPGTRATTADLAWLRSRGIDRAIHASIADGATVLGICGGYQMLGRTIVDDLESEVGEVAGLGLLDAVTTFATPKVVRRTEGRWGAIDLRGYEIRFGRTVVDGRPWLEVVRDDGFEPEGAVSDDGRVLGTSLHGLFDVDEVRDELLRRIVRRRGLRIEASPIRFADVHRAHHDRLADWLESEVDVDALVGLATAGSTA